MRNGETFPVNSVARPPFADGRKILATRKSNADSNGEVSRNSGKRRDKSSTMRDGRKELTRVVKANPGSQHTAKPLCFAVVGAGNPERGQKKTRKTKKYRNLTCRKLRIDVSVAKIGWDPWGVKND
jgi:hypothetical protein